MCSVSDADAWGEVRTVYASYGISSRRLATIPRVHGYDMLLCSTLTLCSCSPARCTCISWVNKKEEKAFLLPPRNWRFVRTLVTTESRGSGKSGWLRIWPSKMSCDYSMHGIDRPTETCPLEPFSPIMLNPLIIKSFSRDHMPNCQCNLHTQTTICPTKKISRLPHEYLPYLPYALIIIEMSPFLLDVLCQCAPYPCTYSNLW
jgi:hypothetical protein